MSNIQRLGTSFERLNEVLSAYEADIDASPPRLQLKGKTLTKANEEQAGWYAYYDTKRVELKALVKYLETRVAATRGRLYRQYTEVYSRELSDRMKDKYIDHDVDYTTVQEVLIEVEEVYEKMHVVTEAFKTRGFALRNLTDIVVNQVSDYTIQ